MKLDTTILGLVLILALFGWICVTTIARQSITNDELAHISAGYSYIKTGDYRMNEEHPPFVKLLAGAFLLPLNPKLPLDHPSWAARREWIFGDRFFFQANTNPDQLVFWARIPMVLLGALLILFVYIWGRELFGPLAGLVAAFFTALDPTVIAMSTVVHTDIGITAFGFATTYAFWRFCRHRSWSNLVLAGLALGLAVSSKFTGLYFFLILALLAVVVSWKEHADLPFSTAVAAPRARQLYLLTGILFLIAIGLFVLMYHFTELDHFYHGMRDVSLHSTTGHRSFLHGVYSDTGFWYYFPVAFLIKTPLPTLLLILLGFLLWKKMPLEQKTDSWFLLLPAIVYFALFMINRINIGVRHVLPVLPFLIVFSSRAVYWKSWLKHAIIALLIVWLSWNAYAISPHYLSSFNELIDGPDHGHEWLIDSNIDWGQDLKGLAAWLQERGNPPVMMAYFGHDDRDLRNITWEELKCGPQAGLIAISVNHLVGFDANLSQCSAWLRKREPIAKIGYSIFIYNVTEESIVQEREDYCMEKCKEKCHREKQMYISSRFEEKCKCTCTGLTQRAASESKTNHSINKP